MWQINKAITEHKKLVETSGRLQRMLPDKDAFVENLTNARQAAYEVQNSFHILLHISDCSSWDNAHSFHLTLCRTNIRQFSLFSQSRKFYNSLNPGITGFFKKKL